MEKREDVISGPYNTRQNQLARTDYRGKILSSDGRTLAYTETDPERVMKQEFILAEIVCRGKAMTVMEKTELKRWLIFVDVFP